LIENLLLSNVSLANEIEVEFLNLKTMLSLKDYSTVFDIDTGVFTSTIFLTLVKWSYPDADLDIIFLVTKDAPIIIFRVLTTIAGVRFKGVAVELIKILF
jgi:hypothetical protein